MFNYFLSIISFLVFCKESHPMTKKILKSIFFLQSTPEQLTEISKIKLNTKLRLFQRNFEII